MSLKLQDDIPLADDDAIDNNGMHQISEKIFYKLLRSCLTNFQLSLTMIVI